MKSRTIHSLKCALFFSATLVVLLSVKTVMAQAGLQVTYGNKGIQTIAYNGVVLDDIGAYGSDAFHIWHMKSTDLNGNLLSVGGYGWGESNNGESWNAQTNTETYTFSWGTVATQFVQSGDNLNMIVTEMNNAGSGIIFDGAEIYPFVFHFPQEPVNFYGYNQFLITSRGPGVSAADFGSGVVTSVIPNESLALYGGWKSAGNSTYTPIMTATSPDNLPSFMPKSDRPLQPGSSLTYMVSLRFTPEGTTANTTDAYASFAATYPSQMTWTDKRIIGTAYLASSPSESDITQPGGFPTNPRRYFNDASVNITTASGLQAFQDRMLTQAATNVSSAQAMNSQGVITWDIEGEQYAQSTSYVCSPDQIGAVAPEMESTITDTSSAYYGQKLDDAYFKTMTNAGLKIGVCLRPQMFTLGANRTASQVYLTTNATIIANLETKASYANARWGATIFYVDSTVDTYGGTLDPAIFQQLITDYPSFLFIPEESTPRYYAYSAPFYSFLFQTNLGTPASTYSFYPNAFGVNLVNDVSTTTLSTYTPQLTQSVKNGDILMAHADYFQANDPTLVSIYQAAGVGGSKPQVTPVVTWPMPSAITYGTWLSATQLNASANVPGSFVYTPSAGTVLNAGPNTLLLTFTPTDTVDYKSTTTSTNVMVTQATPSISWPAPSSIAYGTALSGMQLNATANVPGSFSYTPAAGSVLQVGSSTLYATFTPASANYTSTSTSTNLTVTQVVQATPVIAWAAPSAIAYGTALSSVQLNASASVAGTFSYTPGAGSVLGAGTTTLLATFTPADTTDYKTSTASTYVTVTQGTPGVTWPIPSTITYGTALSGVQLNASASVAGSFVYTPLAGTVLNAGVNTLLLTFTPADTTDYKPVTALTKLTVNQAVPVVSWAVPSPIVYGTVLSSAQLNASANVAGSFSYTPGAGTVLPVGTNTLNVTFTPANTTNYTSVSASATLTVMQTTQSTPQINWATPAAITYGTALSRTQLNATANIRGSFFYTPSAGAVLGAGVNTLQVTFTPADSTDYKVVSTTVHLSVGKATPTLLWAVPSAITAGTALSGSQLNATASVPGSFVYSPAAGTVLNAGTTTLTVTFTPTDTTDYSIQTTTVGLTVNAVVPANIYLAIVSPTAGQTVSGTINVMGYVRLYLDSAGSFLIVDGQPYGNQRVTSAPYSYPLDTTTLTNGTHTLQLWAHDISNNVTISAPVTVIVAN